ncbi:MAG: HAMP domain-containing histidine kinase [[Lactobacillus] timonensis]|jgi:signal transduction histidine kinase|nr:HAMP domain-containing histidine kinase [[Lactobacillus] timonensis]
MIKTLRRKFIVISTVALLLVLVTIIGSISFASFYRNNQEVDSVLDTLVENNGQISRSTNVKQVPSVLTSPQRNRERIFQYRFFSTRVSGNGQITAIDDRQIETVPDNAIKRLSHTAFRQHRNQGTIYYNQTAYAYKKKKINNQTLIVFLDKSILLANSYDLLQIAILIGLVSMLLYTLILVGLSKHAIRPLIIAEKRQREFISNAGHELKTPLAVIAANNEMQELTTGENEWTNSNKDQISRLTRLINNLISLTRLGERPNLNIAKTNISRLTQQASHNFMNVMKQSKLQYQVNIQNNVFAQVDHNYYPELVNILLDNAQKYCDQGGTVSLTLKDQRHPALIVSNSYAAGADVDYTKFFERFYREDTAHQAKGGFGIGLSMAKQIVSDFHGQINANYQDGQISFTVTLKS